jgi:hypothetical protein
VAARNRVAEILLKAQLIDDMQMRSALATLDQWGGRLAHIIAERHFASEDAIVKTLAGALGVQQLHVGGLSKDAGALAKLDVDFCEKNGVFPISLRDNGKTLAVAMADPSDLALIDLIGQKARARVMVAISGESEIQAAIARHYRNKDPNARPSPMKGASATLPGESDEEMKITDMAGSTVARFVPELEQIRKNAAAEDAAAARGSRPSRESAADLLEEMLGGAPQLTAEELQRVRSVKENQDKSGKILRALTELLLEKGYLSAKDLAKLKPY